MSDAPPLSPAAGEVTRLIRLAGEGDRLAFERLLALVYDELRRVAAGELAAREAAQVVVDERHELVERRGVAGVGGAQQAGDLSRRREVVRHRGPPGGGTRAGDGTTPHRVRRPNVGRPGRAHKTKVHA